MTPAIQSQIRDELRIRKLALSYFGHQGIQDLAVLGAILGNNIREIGRYKVTCDGSLVQGQYTIYELVHFGILFATGRTKTRCTRRRRHLHETIQPQTSTISRAGDKQGETATRIYPTMLANLFPAVVFKTLRKKSRQLPRLSEENSDDENEESSSSSVLPLRRFRRRSSSCSGSGDYSAFASSSMFLRRDSSDSTASGHSITNTSTTNNDIHQDPFLVSAGSVVTLLIKNRLHRVKDLPMPRELCFMGAVSLPLPPALRAMHVAWTMDFLATKATTQRRARRQQQHGVRSQSDQATDSSPAEPMGGLEFRQDVYAHKMAIARTVRAQQLKHRQQQDQKNTAPSQTSSSSSSSSYPQPQQNRLSLSMGQPRQSFLIPEQINEEEEEDFDESVSEARVSSDMQSDPLSPILSFDPTDAHNATTSCATTATTASDMTNTESAPSANHIRSIRQSKRLMQQILSLENKVPRSVRKWAVVARTCFSHELVAEDRLVQEWVDKQRIQVVLACGGRMSASQQMLSMHLWLSVLVSPLSPQQMVYDRFME
ncbi:hypothetical protein BG000_010951 [Podila horticola]|nr:hypothetical protein BG000_010951 [Podila horticola]